MCLQASIITTTWLTHVQREIKMLWCLLSYMHFGAIVNAPQRLFGYHTTVTQYETSCRHYKLNHKETYFHRRTYTCTMYASFCDDVAFGTIVYPLPDHIKVDVQPAATSGKKKLSHTVTEWYSDVTFCDR